MGRPNKFGLLGYWIKYPLCTALGLIVNRSVVWLIPKSALRALNGRQCLDHSMHTAVTTDIYSSTAEGEEGGGGVSLHIAIVVVDLIS